MEAERKKNGGRHQAVRSSQRTPKLASKSPEAWEQARDTFLSSAWKEATLPTPGSQISDLQSCKIINSCSQCAPGLQSSISLTPGGCVPGEERVQEADRKAEGKAEMLPAGKGTFPQDKHCRHSTER